MYKSYSDLPEDIIVGEDTLIGRHVEVGDGCVIGTNCEIENNVRIGADVVIAANTIIRNGSYINNECVIGNDVSSIDKHLELSNVGPVVIGHDSYIGTTCIIRHSVVLGTGTILKKGCYIGIGVVIHADSEVGAYSMVDDYVVIEQRSGLCGHTFVPAYARIRCWGNPLTTADIANNYVDIVMRWLRQGMHALVGR